MMYTFVWMIAVLTLCVCDVTPRTIVDLTHTLDENAPKYPVQNYENLTYYGLQTLSESWYPSGMWLSLKKIEVYEHVGTHMDAPFHFGHGRQTMDEIPPNRLVGPGVVINIRDKVAYDPNYAVTVQDVKDYERQYGKIPPHAIVMMNSGWSEKYANANQVFGTNDIEDPASYNFPGWDIDTCKFLLTERQISMLAVDGPSVDPGNLPNYYCHMYLQPYNVPLLEYVANLDTLPPAGTTVVVGSMKHRGGAGGPIRLLAIMGDDDDAMSGCQNTRMPLALHLLLIAGWVFYSL